MFIQITAFIEYFVTINTMGPCTFAMTNRAKNVDINSN